MPNKICVSSYFIDVAGLLSTLRDSVDESDRSKLSKFGFKLLIALLGGFMYALPTIFFAAFANYVVLSVADVIAQANGYAVWKVGYWNMVLLIYCIEVLLNMLLFHSYSYVTSKMNRSLLIES